MSMVSVSLNQIRELTTSDHGLIIHRQKAPRCCVIGNVISINEQTTKLSYIVDDYSGARMEIALWKNGDENSKIRASDGIIMEQTYIKAFGQPRKDPNGEIYFVAFFIQPLENLNELTIHILEIVKHAKDFKKMKINLLCNKESSETDGNFNGNLSSQLKGAPKISGFNEVQNLVLDLIKKDQSENGISYDEIFQSLRSIKQDNIKAAIEFLCNEGHVYEALDDSHFKSSD